MPKKTRSHRSEPSEAPRTDLPPEREPYYEGYFGTEEEEGVVREEEAGDEQDGEEEAKREAARKVAEDAAGGDREIS